MEPKARTLKLNTETLKILDQAETGSVIGGRAAAVDLPSAWVTCTSLGSCGLTYFC